MPSNYKIINLMGLAGKDDEEEAVSGSPRPCLKKEIMVIEGSDDEEEADYSMEEEEEEEYSSGTYTSPSSSSSPPPDSSSPDGPLFQLSDLMAQLPIKRGLSRYYEGKSQSYTSLASVKSVEDLMKNEKYKMKMKMKMKWCRSYGCFSPKATISKKASSRTTCMLRF